MFKAISGVAASVAAVIITAIFLGPIPVVSDVVNRVAYSVGLGPDCRSETVQQAAIKLIKQRALTALSDNSILEIIGAAASGSKGEINECRAVLSIKLSAKSAKSLFAVAKEIASLSWDANMAGFTISLNYEFARDVVYLPEETLASLTALNQLFEAAASYETLTAQSQSETSPSPNAISSDILDDREIATICHDTKNYKFDQREAVENSLINRRARLTFIVRSFDPQTKFIDAEIVHHRNHESEFIVTGIDASGSSLPSNFGKGSQFIAEGPLDSGVLWGNVIEGCFVKFTTASVTPL